MVRLGRVSPKDPGLPDDRTAYAWEWDLVVRTGARVGRLRVDRGVWTAQHRAPECECEWISGDYRTKADALRALESHLGLLGIA